MKSEPKKTDWIDIHSHLTGDHPGVFRVNNVFLQDFQEDMSMKVFSCGLHPWHISQYENIEDLIPLLRSALNHQGLIAIGEAGLDKIIPVPMERQIEIFRKQAELSEESGIPMIVHCVKAFQELLKIRKEMNAKQRWILHGFNSSSQLAGDLVKKGIYISAGPRLMNNTLRCKDILGGIPIQYLFIETDDEDSDMAEIYMKIADCLEITPEELRVQVQENYKEIFLP